MGFFPVVGSLSKLDIEKTACKFKFGWFLDKSTYAAIWMDSVEIKTDACHV